ncbi:adenylate cyclase [Acrasis kona]|uniref:Adenylate cyclase n=1 Tax=Acrasis kona TaxID=1008807 RepID=A0AAW2Z0Y6_9EUKA
MGAASSILNRPGEGDFTPTSKGEVYQVDNNTRRESIVSIGESVQAASIRKKQRELFELNYEQEKLKQKTLMENQEREAGERIARRRKQQEEIRERQKEKKRIVSEAEQKEQEDSRKVYQGATDPDNEDDRVTALKSFNLLGKHYTLRLVKNVSDTSTDSHFDRITKMVKNRFQVNVGLVSLVDKHRQWFKSANGLAAKQTCRNVAFCSYAVKMVEPLIVPDAILDERFVNNPLVTGPPYLRFYAGAQLTTTDGFNVGTLCIAHSEPKPGFGQNEEVEFLQDMAKVVIREMELSKKLNMSKKSEVMQANITRFSQETMKIRSLKLIYELAVVTIAESLDVDLVNVVELTPNEIDGYHTLASFGYDSGVRNRNTHSIRSLVDAVSFSKQTLIIEDISKEVGNSMMPPLIRTFNIKSMIFDIVEVDQEARYLVGCFKTEKYVWSLEEIMFMDGICKSLSGIIQREMWGKQISEERVKADNLLLNILPTPIFHRMKKNEKNIADGIASATILFADIVGFTELSSNTTPKELVSMLNLIFSSFDRIAQQHGCEKVKTIGDCYLCCAGLLNHEDDHAEAIINFALDALDNIHSDIFQTKYKINIRVGINTGPVVAGVIGLDKFVYDIWGNAVNVASRMESHGEPGRIQISKATYKSLEQTDSLEKFSITERGYTKIKGKGEIKTFWVERKK